jgi:glycosyltransferase involved in cell wall biosynthesis
MKIGIDYRPALLGRAGIGRYTRQIVEAMLPLLTEEDEAVLFGVSYQRPLWTPEGELRRARLLRGRMPNRLLALLGRFGLWSVERFTGDLDLFYYTDFVYPPLRKSPYVMMLYDLLFLHDRPFHPPLFKKTMQQRVRRALQGAAGVVVPSETVARDLDRFFPERSGGKKVKVIPMGGDHLLGKDRPGLDLPDKYFMALGTVEPRKNLERLLKAFERAGEDLEGVRLVVAGRPGWLHSSFYRLLAQSPVRERVVLKEDGDDPWVATALKKAAALAYPSLGEGFGLPVAEAMALGCPVITSDRSALPEVARGAALLVDPEDTHALCEAMVRMAKEPLFREEKIRAGLNRSKELTWKRAARETLAFFRERKG